MREEEGVVEGEGVGGVSGFGGGRWVGVWRCGWYSGSTAVMVLGLDDGLVLRRLEMLGFDEVWCLGLRCEGAFVWWFVYMDGVGGWWV